jgi:hypothetical protein
MALELGAGGCSLGFGALISSEASRRQQHYHRPAQTDVFQIRLHADPEYVEA